MSSQKFSNRLTVTRDQLDVEYIENFIDHTEADKSFQYLVDYIPWEQREITIMGKKMMQPRLICWYGEVAYTYSRSTLLPKAFPKKLLSIKQQIEELSKYKFNSCLLNYYRDGQDSMGYHADDEKQLGVDPVIASVSFGGVRRFVLKHKLDKTIDKLEIQLSHGSLLLMKGKTQHFWVHGIPKTKKLVAPRINLTFRWTNEV